MQELCEGNIGESVKRRPLSIRCRALAHLQARSQSGNHRVIGSLIRNLQVHVPLTDRYLPAVS